MLYFIEYLRAVATALIANSHFKGVYPNDIFSFGGGYGLALFFMISGYLLVNIHSDTRFIPWFGKKLLRLYVPLYIVRVIELVLGNTGISSIRDFVINFIFPGSWFGGSLIIMYILYFILVKYWLKGEQDNKALIIIGVAALSYIVLFIFKPEIASFSMQTMKVEKTFGVETPYLLTQFIWLSCMIIGYWLRVRKPEAKKKVLLICTFVLSVMVFLAVKLVTRNGEHMNAEIILGLSYVCFAITLFALLLDAAKWCEKVWHTAFGKFVSIISSCSLEIYYIQFVWIRLLKKIVFPVNLSLLIIAIVMSGYAIHRLSEQIIKELTKMGISI